MLRKELWSRGLRYRVDVPDLAGRPDIVFRGTRVLVFCDGDFWHGRNLAKRIRKLAEGHNASYWVVKIRRNAERDRRNSAALAQAGWAVLRYWESDILGNTAGIADEIEQAVRARVSSSKLPRL